MEIKFTIINEWKGGIPGGSLCFFKNSYLVRFQDGTRNTFSLFNCENLEDAKKQAEEYQRIQSLQKGLTKNRHRLIECDTGGKYMEL